MTRRKGRPRRWQRSDWLLQPTGGGEYQPDPVVVMGVNVLMLLAAGRSDAEVVALHMGVPGGARLGRGWWEDLVPKVRKWAEEHAGRASELPGLLAYLSYLDPRSRANHPRYSEALVMMAAGQAGADAEAAGWVLRDAADLAGRMAAN